MAVIYQVLDWNRHFENFKSRSVDRCAFVCVPNKQHGEGLSYVLSLPDGLSIYGVFNLVLGACSQHAKPRDGWLTNDGAPTGKPWAPKSLSIRWRRTEKEIARALQVLTSAEVGWIAAREVSGDGYQADTAKSLNGRELKGREEKGIEAHAARASCSEPEIPASEPPLLSFPIVGKGSKTWDFTEGCRADLSSAFPDVDVLAESRKALAWVQANSNRRKTTGGMRRFLTGWMARTNDRGGGSNGHGSHQIHAEELDPADAEMIESMYPGGKRR